MRLDKRIRFTCGLIVAIVGFCVPAHAESDGASRALGALLRSGDIAPSKTSGCSGTLPDRRNPTIGDLVANRLSYLDGGENRVRGRCSKQGQCTVSITHADGEDVENAVFQFELFRGRARGSTMRCRFTP